jgi:pyruvate/2-oxoglutarate dehydrogenase complex dihydrolipoamide acyltransferase (E2) component
MAFAVATGAAVRSASRPLLDATSRLARFSASARFSSLRRVISMPKLSPSMTHGRVLSWNVAKGDTVREYDTLMMVSTTSLLDVSDEVEVKTLLVEIMEEGFIAQLAAVDDAADVPVGQPLGLLCEEEDDVEEASRVDVSGLFTVFSSCSSSHHSHLLFLSSLPLFSFVCSWPLCRTSTTPAAAVLPACQWLCGRDTTWMTKLKGNAEPAACN